MIPVIIRDRSTGNTEKKAVRNGRGKDWSYMQPKPKDSWSHHKLEEARTASPLERSEGARPCQHLSFGFLASKIVREYTSTVVSHPVYGNCLQQPLETNMLRSTQELQLLFSSANTREAESQYYTHPSQFSHNAMLTLYKLFLLVLVLKESLTLFSLNHHSLEKRVVVFWNNFYIIF